MKTPNIAGFVGHSGDNVWLEPSQQYEDDAQLVQDWPDLFDDVTPPEPEPVRRGPGRPKKYREGVYTGDLANKPHAVD